MFNYIKTLIDRQIKPKYFECHVTIDPVFGDDLERFKEVSGIHRFKVAKLLMKKGKDDTAEPSKMDAFATARSDNYRKMLGDLEQYIWHLSQSGFIIRRAKIEAVLLDVKFKRKKQL